MSRPARGTQAPKLRRTALAAALAIGAGAGGAYLFSGESPKPTTATGQSAPPAAESPQDKAVRLGQEHFERVAKTIGFNILDDLQSKGAHAEHYTNTDIGNKSYLIQLGLADGIPSPEDDGPRTEVYAQYNRYTHGLILQEMNNPQRMPNVANEVQLSFMVGDQSANALTAKLKEAGQLTGADYATILQQRDVTINQASVQKVPDPRILMVSKVAVGQGGLRFLPDQSANALEMPELAPAQTDAVAQWFETDATMTQADLHNSLPG